MVVGVPAMSQRLVLRDDQNKDICTLADDNAMLGAYPAEDHMGLHVRAHRPRAPPLDSELQTESERASEVDRESC